MAKVPTNISLDSELKDKAIPVLNELGLDLSTAIGIFLRQTVREQRLPFEVSLHVPNDETKAALLEIQDMRAHPEKYKRYRSFAEALREVFPDA